MSDDIEKDCKEFNFDNGGPFGNEHRVDRLIEFVKKQIYIASTDSEAWIDAKDEWSDAIRTAHPIESDSHEQYAIAMQMVSNRYSKGAIVSLINWLLVRIAKADDIVRCVRALDGDPKCLSDFWEDIGPRIKEYKAMVKP